MTIKFVARSSWPASARLVSAVASRTTPVVLGAVSVIVAVSVLAATAPLVTSSSDTTPPDLQGLTLSPATVNVGGADPTITLTSHFVDASGLKDYGFFLRMPSGDSWGEGGPAAGTRISGNSFDGIYRMTMSFETNAEVGTWSVDGVVATDTVGNVLEWNEAQLAAAGLPTTFEVIYDDILPPTATLTRPATPTSASTLQYTLLFSEGITGLAASDFAVSGTATGCVVGTPGGSGDSYAVDLTGCSAGTVILELTADSVIDLGGNAGPASPATAQPVTIAPSVPTAPLSVTARAGVNQAKVYWDAPLSDGRSTVTSYAATASPGGQSCSAGGSARACYVTGLSNGLPYTFTVTASNAIGPSAASLPSNAVTPAQDTHDPVLVSTSVTPTRVSSFGGTVTVELRITDDLSGRRTPSGALDANPAILFDKGSGTTSVGFTRAVSLVSGDEYDGIYRATVTIPSGTAIGPWYLLVYPIDDNAGNSTFFVREPGIVVGTPGAPTGVTASSGPDREVTVTWDAPADDGGNVITGYEVTTAPGGEVRTTGTTNLTSSFINWPADMPVTFTVKAINGAGMSDASAPSMPLIVPATAPSPPTLTAASAADSSVTATWVEPATGGAPIVHYTLTAQPGGSSCTTTALSCTISGLSNGTPYAVVVTATNSAGTSSPSSPSDAVVPATVPSPPTGLSATPIGATVMASWAAPASDGGAPVTSYTASVTPGGQSCTTSGALSCSISGLADGEYTANVVARNRVGSSAHSAADAFLIDATQPAATLTSALNATNLSTVTYSLSFSESVVDLTASDFLRFGTAPGCTVSAPVGSGASYLVDVTGCSDGTVSLTLTANSVTDGGGNLGPTADVTATSVLIDTVAPSTTALAVAPRTGATLSGSAIPLALTWHASTDAAAGIDGYEVEQSTNGGSWSLIGTYDATSTAVTAASSGSFRYRVRAVDAAGNPGAWADSATLSPRLAQQSSSAVKYGGIWTTTKSSSYSGGSAKYAKAAGRSATYKFTGRSIALVTTKAKSRGKVKIYVNGVYQGKVDLYRSSAQYRVVAWQKTWSTAATRTIKVVVVGTSGRPRVDLDAFVVVK